MHLLFYSKKGVSCVFVVQNKTNFSLSLIFFDD
jgi:hypothetical protein